jgi:hypothetical protein
MAVEQYFLDNYRYTYPSPASLHYPVRRYYIAYIHVVVFRSTEYDRHAISDFGAQIYWLRYVYGF